MIVDGRITLERYVQIRSAVFAAGYREDWEWSETIRPPETPEDLAREYTFVVINSGMKATVARGIFERVSAHQEACAKTPSGPCSSCGRAVASGTCYRKHSGDALCSRCADLYFGPPPWRKR